MDRYARCSQGDVASVYLARELCRASYMVVSAYEFSGLL